MHRKLRKTLTPFVVLTLTAALGVVGCANQMQPAQQALDGATSAVSAAEPDASRYLPDEFKALQARVTELKSEFDGKNYSAVISAAPSVRADATTLAQKAATRKAEAVKALTDQWTTLSASLPQLIATVKTRVDSLGKARHPPKGVDLPAAKSALAEASALWDKANAAYMSGHVDQAIDTAKQVTPKIDAAATAAKVKLPSAS